MNPTNKRDKWLEIALKKENLKSYKINYTASTTVGDGFLGDITFVNIQAITNDGKPKVYDFVIKDGDRYTDTKFKIPSLKIAYERESFFYKTVLPQFTKFQQERNIEQPFNAVPKCFDALQIDGIDVLILENAKIDGYEMHDMKTPVNWKHLEMVFKEYAKYHAISFAFKDQNPEGFAKLTDYAKEDIMRELLQEMNVLEMMKNTYKDIMNIFEKRNELKLLDKCKIMESEIDRFFLHVDYKSEPNAILVHGDCWCKNYLYKYKDDKQENPESCLLLDWQISKLAPPAWDLVYYFYCSAGSENFNRYSELLDIYYNELSTRITELGSDPETICPKTTIFEQWKKYARFGLIMAPSMYQLALTKKEDLPTTETSENFTDLFKFNFDEDVYAEKVIALLTHMISNDFF